MTEARPRHDAWPPKVWGPCVLAGLVLIAFAVVLVVNRTAPANAGHAVPVVNAGRLPPETSADVPPRRTARARLVPGSRLQLARLGVDAPITAVTTVGNVMQIPRDPHTLGWWRDGSAPDESTGTTVIVGHINYAGVTGALTVLPEARPGDAVAIVEGHRAVHYRVTAIRTYPKSSGIPADVFNRSGRARLVLITCGGPFDGATGNYEDNIVAYAQPV